MAQEADHIWDIYDPHAHTHGSGVGAGLKLRKAYTLPYTCIALYTVNLRTKAILLPPLRRAHARGVPLNSKKRRRTASPIASPSGSGSCSSADRLRAAASKALSSRPGCTHRVTASGPGGVSGVARVVGVVAVVVAVVLAVVGVGVGVPACLGVGVGALPASTSTRCPKDHHCASCGRLRWPKR